MARGRVQWRVLVNTVMNVVVKVCDNGMTSYKDNVHCLKLRLAG
jgi:hypothetical protein